LSSCLSDSKASNQEINQEIRGQIVKISKDTVFLKGGAKVSIPGINSGNKKILVLTRHAEKDTIGMDPGLSPLGEDRATRLADIMQSAALEQIFVTHYRRVYLTVRPLAVLHNMGLERYEPTDQGKLIEQLKKEADGTYVVCGHSNSIPEVLTMLGKETDNLSESDYDNLWIVAMNPGEGQSKFYHFTY